MQDNQQPDDDLASRVRDTKLRELGVDKALSFMNSRSGGSGGNALKEQVDVFNKLYKDIYLFLSNKT